MTKGRRLPDIYTGAAIAILLLVSTANAAWLAMFALALLAAGLVVFPGDRKRIVTVALLGAATAVVVAALVRVFA
ncbi:MAG TPA: hypothetical protein VFA31_06225 [Candidatus Polarisedimenticolia bacterium]|jgi:hypothetical protein|nr:hypothetical protein [Candidatus Polarisedimenticolia bacterium]